MAAICANRTAGVHVKRTFRVAAADGALGSKRTSLHLVSKPRNGAETLIMHNLRTDRSRGKQKFQYSTFP